MKNKKFNLYEEQKELVLARFKTLNTNAKILLGGEGQFTVKDLMHHIEEGDELGKKIVKVQINMLKTLSSI